MLIDFFAHLFRTPPAIGAFTEAGHEILDDPEMAGEGAAEQPEDLSPLVGASLGIEYLSAKGQTTLRRIAVARVDGAPGARPQLWAFCHLRKAYRRFNLDRIRAVYDEDGVVVDPGEFFARFDLAPSSDHTAARRETTDRLIRREWRHELRLLTAMARADGRLGNRECDVILDYASAEAERCDIFPDEGDIERLAVYVRRLYPAIDTVSASLDQLRAKSKPRRDRFLRAAGRVMNADDVQEGREFDLLMELRDALAEGAVIEPV